jgi:hypothetical protein
MAYDPVKAQELLQLVLKKIEVSAEHYQDAYVLNDVPREVSEEIVDILGWTLLECLRVQETVLKRVYQIDRIHWEKFLKNQTDDFLVKLHDQTALELGRRYNESRTR